MQAPAERLPLRMLDCLAQGCRCWLQQQQQRMRKPQLATPHLSSPATRQHLINTLAHVQTQLARWQQSRWHSVVTGVEAQLSEATTLTCMLMAVLMWSTAIATSPAGCSSATLKYTSRPPRPPGCS